MADEYGGCVFIMFSVQFVIVFSFAWTPRLSVERAGK